MTSARLAAVISHARPGVMAAAVSLIVCGLFLWGVETRSAESKFVPCSTRSLWRQKGRGECRR